MNKIIAILAFVFATILLVIAFKLPGGANEAQILTCRMDEDCVLTNYPQNNCCKRCDTFVLGKTGEKVQEEWRKYNCNYDSTTCVEYECSESKKRAVCKEGLCALSDY